MRPPRLLVLVVPFLLVAASWPPPASEDTPIDIVIAGSLSLSGDGSDLATAAFEGLVTVAEACNNRSHPPGGACRVANRPLNVLLNISDDQGLSAKAAIIYEDLVRRHDPAKGPLLLIGPSSDNLSIVAATAFNQALRERNDSDLNSSAVLMLHRAATLDARALRLPRVFSVSPSAEKYLSNTVQLLRARGVEFLTVVYQADDPFYTAACEGAIIEADSSGMTIKGIPILSGWLQLVPEQIDTVAPRSAFLGCTDSTHTAMWLSVLKSYVPAQRPFEGIVFTHVADGSTIKKLRPGQVNYLLSPTVWGVGLRTDDACPVFGSAAGFSAVYRSIWDVEPTDTAALAAAAALALLGGVSNYTVDISSSRRLSSAALQRSLQGLNMQSFMGNLRFDGSGLLFGDSRERVNASGTFQLRPHITESKLLLLTLSDPELISGPSQLVWPTPAWLPKALEVVPCEPGYEVNSVIWTNSSSDLCIPCPAGTVRNEDMVQCTKCSEGYFQPMPGQSRCIPCPDGANCALHTSTSFGNIRVYQSLPGWYATPGAGDMEYLTSPENMDDAMAEIVALRGFQQFFQCEPAFLCLGNNRCSGHNDGFLCSSCTHGYRRIADSVECTPCPSRGVCIFMLTLLLSFLSIFLFGFGQSVFLNSGTDRRMVYNLTFKLVFNHGLLTFCTLTAVPRQFITIFENWEIISFAFLDPLITIGHLDCLARDELFSSYLSWTRTLIIFTILVMPAGMVLTLMSSGMSWHCRRQRERYVLQKAMNNRVDMILQMRKKESMMAATEDMAYGSGDNVDYSQKDVNEQKALRHLAAELGNREEWNFKEKVLLRQAVCVFFIHPLVIATLARSMYCVEYDTLRSGRDLNVLCSRGPFREWRLLCLWAIGIIGFGVPIAMFLFLRQCRHLLMEPSFRNSFGFLYRGFEDNYYYWECVLMIRKVIIFIILAIPDDMLRMSFFLITIMVSLCLHLRCEPYDNRFGMVFDQLETTSLLMSLVMVLSCFLRGTLANARGQQAEVLLALIPVNTTLTVIVAFIQLYVFYLLFYVLFDQFLMRRLRIKAAAVRAEELSLKDVLLLRLFPGLHQIEYDYKRACFDLSQLTRFEMRALESAIRETVPMYMRTDDKPFHPVFIVACLHRALSLIGIENRELESALLKKLEQGKRSGLFGSLRKSWRRFVSKSKTLTYLYVITGQKGSLESQLARNGETNLSLSLDANYDDEAADVQDEDEAEPEVIHDWPERLCGAKVRPDHRDLEDTAEPQGPFTRTLTAKMSNYSRSFSRTLNFQQVANFISLSDLAHKIFKLLKTHMSRGADSFEERTANGIGGADVDQIQLYLQMCWPDILKKTKLFFESPVKPAKKSDEKPRGRSSGRASENRSSTMGNGSDGLSPRNFDSNNDFLSDDDIDMAQNVISECVLRKQIRKLEQEAEELQSMLVELLQQEQAPEPEVEEVWASQRWPSTPSYSPKPRNLQASLSDTDQEIDSMMSIPSPASSRREQKAVSGFESVENPAPSLAGPGAALTQRLSRMKASDRLGDDSEPWSPASDAASSISMTRFKALQRVSPPPLSLDAQTGSEEALQRVSPPPLSLDAQTGSEEASDPPAIPDQKILRSLSSWLAGSQQVTDPSVNLDSKIPRALSSLSGAEKMTTDEAASSLANASAPPATVDPQLVTALRAWSSQHLNGTSDEAAAPGSSPPSPKITDPRIIGKLRTWRLRHAKECSDEAAQQLDQDVTEVVLEWHARHVKARRSSMEILAEAHRRNSLEDGELSPKSPAFRAARDIKLATSGGTLENDSDVESLEIIRDGLQSLEQELWGAGSAGEAAQIALVLEMLGGDGGDDDRPRECSSKEIVDAAEMLNGVALAYHDKKLFVDAVALEDIAKRLLKVAEAKKAEANGETGRHVLV